MPIKYYFMRNVAFALLVLVFSSCSTPKNMVYFSDTESFMGREIANSYINTIQKDDLLSITVESKTPELAVPFNQIVATANSASLKNREYGYLVNSEGNIVFPILGRMKVEGLKYSELSSIIEQRIMDGGYINDPTVNVRLLNYKIAVLGEVKTPGVKTIESERITLFDALSLAGDLTIYGKRENISIIREENGVRELARVDISSGDIFTSPYYYLHPNDIVYVEPNKKQQRQSTSNQYLLPSILSGTSLLVTIITLLTR